MPTRREVSAARRASHYGERIEAAETSAGRFYATVAWLAREARRSGRLEEITAELRRIIDLLREGKPLSVEPAAAPAPQTAPAPPADLPPEQRDLPWYELARIQQQPTPDRTEHDA